MSVTVGKGWWDGDRGQAVRFTCLILPSGLGVDVDVLHCGGQRITFGSWFFLLPVEAAVLCTPGSLVHLGMLGDPTNWSCTVCPAFYRGLRSVFICQVY